MQIDPLVFIPRLESFSAGLATMKGHQGLDFVVCPPAFLNCLNCQELLSELPNVRLVASVVVFNSATGTEGVSFLLDLGPGGLVQRQRPTS